MPSIFEYSATGTNRHEFITIIDHNGNRYKVELDRQQGGFRIVKDGGGLVDAITVHPSCVNEIRVA